MSIYIKGMEMPKNCCQCPVNMEVCKRGYKYLLAHPELYDNRADDCPIIEIPPHGRLIDADALKAQWLEAEKRIGADEVIPLPLRDYITDGCVYDLDNAPTIIEGDKE